MRRIYRIVFLLFICSLYLSGQAQNQSLSLEDFFVNGTFRSKGVYGLRSMNDGEHYTVLENGGKKSRNTATKPANRLPRCWIWSKLNKMT